MLVQQAPRLRAISACLFLSGLLVFQKAKTLLALGVCKVDRLCLWSEFCVLFFAPRPEKSPIFDFQHLKRFKGNKSSFDEASAMKLARATKSMLFGKLPICG